MITDARGKPLIMEGQEGRSIKIIETKVEGKMVWGIDFKPSLQSFEFEEVFQILGDVIRGIAQDARARKHEFLTKQRVQAELNKQQGEK